jgi:hypothetical protein
MALCPGSTETEFHEVAGLKGAIPSAMSAAECVRIGLDDYEQGKRVSLTGLRTKAMAFATRFAPRRLVHKAAASMMRNRR